MQAQWQKISQLALALVTLSLMSTGYLNTQTEVTLVINGHHQLFRTHQIYVEAVLKDAGLTIHLEDIVSPGLQEAIEEGQVITVRQAKPVTIEVDGRVIRLRTHARTMADLLEEAEIELGPYDKVLIEEQEVSRTASLANPNHLQNDDPPLSIAVHRAVPIHVVDGGVPSTVYTTQATVGEALRAQNITLYLGDQVSPSLSDPVSTDLHIYILRSEAVQIWVDSHIIKTRTRKETVSDVLAQEGIVLMGKDYIEPKGDAPIREHMDIWVVRVGEEIAIEQEPIPFETAWQPDKGLEIDHQRLEQAGEDGLFKRRFRVVYENGQEVEQAMEDEWVDREPTTKVIAYGTRIVPRELETPQGTIEYWRKVRMLATSYTAATCGKSRDHPFYSITRLGWEMGKGIVAIDPGVINLRSKLYVPGYGLGVAGDTGGKIRGRHIDLGYDEGDLELWRKWVDVYILWPPPPEDEINWVLPSWPQE